MIKSFSIGKWSPHNTDTYYEYDEFGNKIDVKGYHIRKDTILGYHYVFQYNENGQQTKKESKTGYFYDYNEYNTLFTTYDDHKNITQQEYIRNNQTVKMIRYVYTYDSYENWIKREQYEGETEENLSVKLVDEREIEYY